MQRPTKRAFYIFIVFEAYFPNMPAAAGYFNADDFAAVMEINTVVIDLVFVPVVHNFFTLSYTVGYPKYSIRSK